MQARIRMAVNRILEPFDFSLERKSHLASKDVLPVLETLQANGLTVQSALDVGANLGRFSILVDMLWPNAELILVEPQADLLAEAAKRLDRKDKIHFLPVGAGPRDEIATFLHHSRKDSSTFVAIESSTDVQSREQVQVERLESIINRTLGNRIPEIVKLDCEGWDLEVLSGLGSYLGLVPVIFAEAGVSNTFFQNDVSASLAAFEAHGYRLFDFSDAARTKFGACWNIDLCFVHQDSIVWRNASQWSE